MTREVDTSIIGERFGSLTVISYSKKREKGKTTFWNCKCDLCNQISPISRSNLVSGGMESCGCRRRKGMNKKIAEITGFSSATVSLALRNRWQNHLKLETVNKIKLVAEALNYKPWYRERE